MIEQAINAAWEQFGKNPLGKYRDYQEAYVASDERGYSGFINSDRTAMFCSDEGNRIIDVEEIYETAYTATRTAGSGVLPEVRKQVQDVMRGNVSVVFSHAHCGAAERLDNPGNKPSDVRGDEEAKTLARDLGADYGGRLSATHRPDNFHTARTIYVVGVEGFEPSATKLPSGFVTHRNPLGFDVASFDVNTLSGIVFGKQGYGQRVTPQHPLELVGIASSGGNAVSPKTMTRELQNMRDSLGSNKERTRISVIIASS